VSALLALLLLSCGAHAENSSLRVLDRNGVVLQEFSGPDGETRYPVSLGQVSPWAILATVAAEDRRFFSHPGVDWRSLARAAWQNARSGRVVSGGSTLTQQLVRNRNPRPRTVWTKLREAASALLLEREKSKPEILEEYLNAIPYGNRARGIEAASRLYFDKPAAELSIAEAAYLAAIPRAPGSRNPFHNDIRLIKEAHAVLDRMLRFGFLTPELHALARAEEVRAAPPERRLPAPHFAEFVRRWAAGAGATGEVRTTLDASLQREAASILRAHLAALRPNRVRNGALILLDNRSGEVLAWVGSQDFADAEHGQVDGVVALRQPGSALKPFVYGLAVARGRTPADILLDEPFTAPDRFSPRNYDEKYHGPVRLREALACSYNVPAVRVAEELGAGDVLHLLREAGFDSLNLPAEHYGLGLALGNGEVRLLELARAYSALARGGVWKPETFVLGRPSPGAPRRVLPATAAYLITHILSDNAARAPAFGAHSAFNLPFPLAAKTGTSKDYRDNWAVGYTSDWTVGVWVGNFDGSPMAKVSGITGAGPILRDMAYLAAKRLGVREFREPAGIRRAEVCPLSGKLPGPWCPTAISEVFVAGKIPRAFCGFHHAPAGAAAVAATGPSVKFPVQGDIFKLDPAYPRAAQVLRLKADGVERAEKVRWIVDERPLEADGKKGEAWWPLAPGEHRLAVSTLRGARWLSSPPVKIFVAAP
jgi:penicillin-binding protein 1C